MASGGAKIEGRIMCYTLTSDILAGVAIVDQNTLTSSNISTVISDNIFMTVLRINLEGTLNVFSKEEASEILVTGIGYSAGEIAMLNVGIIGKANVNTFIKNLIHDVIDKINTAKIDPKPANLSKKQAVSIAVVQTSRDVCQTNTTRNVSLFVIVLTAMCIYVYAKEKKY